MTQDRLLDLVDSRDFRTLFIDELGWGNPDQPPVAIDLDEQIYTLTQVAGYKGLRIWHCAELPPRKAQRQIDVLIGKDNLERLVIFSNDRKQEWRWPRRAQLGSTNAKLLVHEHLVGDRTTHLTQRLEAIELDFDEDLPLVALLDKMRSAFDQEAETASVAAARLMGTLYAELAAAGVGEHEATLLLARLLFLLFGDDADMWKPDGLFERYLRTDTTGATLHTDLTGLFDVLDTDERQRSLPQSSPYAHFRHINGGLFRDTLRLPPLTETFRDSLIEACEFDWSIISPAVFGSMFQTVKSKDARRAGGEHYTTEENILKTIRPLFLDGYRDRLERAQNDKAQLTKLHNELGTLRILDPACGCGNFLVVAYRELRALELDILKRRRDLEMADAASKKVERAQLSLDVTGDIKVTLDHFFGIEIDEWPARIAETAMLLVDHLANKQMEIEFGVAPDRLPIAIAPTITNANALRTDWTNLVSPSSNILVLGNPPFLGHKERTVEQGEDLRISWRKNSIGHLDYVTGWYIKALDLLETPGYGGQFAFVSTNSIVMGDSVPQLFSEVFDRGWRIKFAYRTFRWTSEATEKAQVHCVIIGFDRPTSRRMAAPRLFELNQKGSLTETRPPLVNAYLADGPNVLVTPRRTLLSPSLPEIQAGSTPIDWDHLVVKPAQVQAVREDPIAAKYLRRYIGGEQLINNKDRWCLWLVDAKPDDLLRSPVLADRISKVKAARLSPKVTRQATRDLARIPHLFGERRQPAGEYLGIPQSFGKSRNYATAARLSADVIASIKLFTAPDTDGFLFAMVSSAMFMTWQRTVGPRTPNDQYSFTASIVWNNLPLPVIAQKTREKIIAAGTGILTVRRVHQGLSLADMYEPTTMAEDLFQAHIELDKLVDRAFGAKSRCTTEKERQAILFARYAELAGSQAGGATW